ncbi:hypothetical protein BDB00DRAFT_633553 [Zychaea mexicana]|uniref:uncharacterized protein n=1 Tax=Zychaea mexicana TaxID=64656 RepID=UPI0022FF027C|nr:uncharacterized protein BDB00DRAFT_633553 [Zychaea mexicana]KAI9489231.1 hypothetical protein BDB00DRAFT_633553 [Zychaea mexicana]
MDLDHLVIPTHPTATTTTAGAPHPPSTSGVEHFLDAPSFPSQEDDQGLVLEQQQVWRLQHEPDFVPKGRRRSCSVPPTFHSEHYKTHHPTPNHHHHYHHPSNQVVFAPIRVAADSRPPPPMMMKPSTPVQIQRLHRSRIPAESPEQQRASMDKQLQRMNFNDVTVAELKHMLRYYGHSTTGRKSELIERLQQERQRLHSSYDHQTSLQQ